MLGTTNWRRLTALVRGETVFTRTSARYAFSVLAVAIALALRIALTPLTGEGAPFVLFFGATLLTSVVAGVGPAIVSLALSLPVGAALYAASAGYSVAQAALQATLYAADGCIVIYITVLTQRRRERLELLNQQMLRANQEREQLLADERIARQEAESANQQLRESEERFRLTIENAPIGMALVGLDGRWVRVNRALCELTGYSADELTQLTFQDITHGDDLDTDVELAGKAARGEIPRYSLEKRYIRKDGTFVDIMLNVSVLRGPDGAPRYYISQIADITERKRAEEAVRLSEAKFSGIVSIASDAIISVDANQRITIFNEGAQDIFGYGRDEVIGTPLERLIPERFRAGHREHLSGFLAGQEVARTMAERREIFGLRKNGDEFPAEASISKVRVDGTMLLSVVLRDVTYRKSVEEALRRAVAARDDVLGIVAHDLRNPLNTIMLQASLLERIEPEVERRDQKVRLGIVRSAKRMNALIKDLLDVAVVESGRFKVEHERVSAEAILRESIDAQKPAATAAGLELVLEVEEGVGLVLGDRNRLLQVLDNLVGNAMKFTKQGGRILVRAVQSGDTIQFSVADSGAGIAPEGLAHVFDRFWQATTRDRRLGAGLGLPIAKGIVDAHGGRIWVESRVGQGTTFHFTVPVAPVETSLNRGRRDLAPPDATAA